MVGRAWLRASPLDNPRPLIREWDSTLTTVANAEARCRLLLHNNMLQVVVCEVCKKNHDKLPFLSPTWPKGTLSWDPKDLALPTKNNLTLFNPVRLWDRIVTSHRMGIRKDGTVGNVVYHTFRANLGSALCAQFVSLEVPVHQAWKYVTCLPSKREVMEKVLLSSRRDLRDYFRHVFGELPVDSRHLAMGIQLDR